MSRPGFPELKSKISVLSKAFFEAIFSRVTSDEAEIDANTSMLTKIGIANLTSEVINRLVPPGGSSGQILTWLSSGRAQWGSASTGTVPESYLKPEPIIPEAVSESTQITEAVMPEHGPSNMEAKQQDLHPFFFGDSDDVVWEIKNVGGTAFLPDGTTFKASKKLKPALGGDKHLGCIDSEDNEWDFWHAEVEESGGKHIIKYQYGGYYPAGDLGIAHKGGLSSATQSGMALTAGPIRASELEAGVINHMLALVVSYCTQEGIGYGHGVVKGTGVGNSSYIHPAGSGCRGNTAAHLPPAGAICRLKISDSDLLALKLPPWQEAIYFAWKRFGACIIDTGGTEALKGYFGFQFEDGEAYVAQGKTNPILDYAKKMKTTTTEGGGFGENGVYINEGQYIFELYENTPESKIKWKTQLEWVAPKPNPINMTRVRKKPISDGRFLPAASPFNCEFDGVSSYERALPAILTQATVE